MASLKTADRVRLVRAISSIPEFASESARRRLMELAGLDSMAHMVDLSGSPFISAATLVDYLADYGRMSDGPEALGQFLNLLLTIVGIEKQEELRQISDRYSLMTPLAPQPAIGPWRGSDNAAGLQEKIIRFNTLRPVSFMAEGARAARSVAFIEVSRGGDQWSGTGFLVAPSLLLTNAHVIPDREHAAASVFLFNYENDADFSRSRELRVERDCPPGDHQAPIPEGPPVKWIELWLGPGEAVT